MSCKSVSDLLPLFDDPELGTAERAAVASHVADCSTCAQELANIRAAQHRLSVLRTVGTPAYGPERVIARIQERRTRGPLGKLGRLFTGKPYWAGTVVAALFTIVLWSALPTSPGADETPIPEAPITLMFAQEDVAPFAAMRMMAPESAQDSVLTIPLESPDPAALALRLAEELERATFVVPVMTELGDGTVQVEIDGATPAAVQEVLMGMEAGGVQDGFDYDASILENDDAQRPTRVVLHLYPAPTSH